MKIAEIINKQLGKLHEHLDKNELVLGEIIFNNGRSQILSQSPVRFELIVSSQLKMRNYNK